MNFISEHDEEQQVSQSSVLQFGRPEKHASLPQTRAGSSSEPKFERPDALTSDGSSEGHKAWTLCGRYASKESPKFMMGLSFNRASLAPAIATSRGPISKPVLPAISSLSQSEPQDRSPGASAVNGTCIGGNPSNRGPAQLQAAENAGNISNFHNTLRHMTTGAPPSLNEQTYGSIPSLMGFTEGLRDLQLLDSDKFIACTAVPSHPLLPRPGLSSDGSGRMTQETTAGQWRLVHTNIAT